MQNRNKILSLLLLALLLPMVMFAQSHNKHWSNTQRQLRYHPEGSDFVIQNGTKRFNRALYGTETPFRVEAGDLPEFAFYMSGFGGNIHVGLVRGTQSIWLPQAQHIEARYTGAGMVYHIRDGLLGEATLTLKVLALADAEGVVLKVSANKKVPDVTLVWAYGGATGKRFSRNGDLNTDPESVFYLTADNCVGDAFHLRPDGFVYQYGNGRELSVSELFPADGADTLTFGNLKGIKHLMSGRFPDGAKLLEADASALQSPVTLMASSKIKSPVLAGQIKGIDTKGHHLLWQVPQSAAQLKHSANAGATSFAKAEAARRQLISRVVIETPDPYINTLGPTIAAAADGIWETPTYLHGAIGWRMRLPGWRGPYTADPLGWHDRAMTHFQAYAESQITSPANGPSVPDPEKNLARQQPKLGTALYTEGYICRNPNGDIRPHHYDMNLVFIDGLLRHFRWTGDVAFIREMWPVLTRHLAWEKRNFDGDNDGLYDAYCCIWASDALEYSGGGVAHSSAYNYLANKMAARLAEVLGENPKPYQQEADKILNAIQTRLWLPAKGWFAEYVDWTGLKRTHDASALWTIYHVLDSEVADPFQAWQSTRYVETSLPKLPVKGKGLDDGGYYVHSTTTWQPYDWSINNVVMAENLHMALSHWQAGRNNEAFHLWKSTLLDAMYLGGSPGNFVQLSFLDAARGEMYRDFADEVGMTARSLVEGLFGVLPNAIDGQLLIKPGFPASWDKASIKTPYIDYQYQYQPKTLRETYRFKMSFAKPLSLTMALPAKADRIKWVKVNGKKVGWQVDAQAVGQPFVLVECGVSANASIEVQWEGDAIETTPVERRAVAGRKLNWVLKNARFIQINDPQQVLVKTHFSGSVLVGEAAGLSGARTTFAKVQQGDMAWWMPLTMHLTDGFVIEALREQPSTGIRLRLHNNGYEVFNGQLVVNHREVGMPLSAPAYSYSPWLEVGAQHLLPGTNLVQWVVNGEVMATADVINWQLPAIGLSVAQRAVNLSSVFNDKVTRIFKNEYLSPRWEFPTLQLPKHGVGNWCYFDIHPEINDAGLRRMAANGNEIVLPLGTRFATPSDSLLPNVAFASLYDNYPVSVAVPLSGQARHLYLLMAGSTNPMQSQIVNGVVTVHYSDGTSDKLELINPENWSPIEQDYFHDGYAFNIQSPMPPRLHLKTGMVSNGADFRNYTSITGYSNRIIEGGAANILDMPLNPAKTLKSLTVEVHSNEVVIGLMGVTVVE